jgi:hypothetical protein
MVLQKEKIAEFRLVAKPLMDWLEQNCHPHCTAIVESDRAELVEAVCVVRKEEK